MVIILKDIEPLDQVFQAVFKIVKKRKQFIQIIFKNKTFFLFLKKEANIHKLILQKNYINYVL